MPDYSKGKIYVIRSPNTPEVFIGATTRSLSSALHSHSTSNSTKARIIVLAGEAYIELLEDYPCARKEILNRRTGELVRATANCVNKFVPGLTVDERIADRQAQYQAGYAAV